MSCCTKNNTKETVKDNKTSCDGVAQTEDMKTTSEKHSVEECTDESCKIHHGEVSEQKTESESCCD